MTRKLSYFFTIAFALVALPAAAAPLDILNIAGVWQNPVGGTSVSGEGTSFITWGDGVAPDSGYEFNASADIVGAGVGVPLLIGTFIHHNETIPVPNLTGVDLDLAFDTNGNPASIAAVFAFAHDETPNSTGTSPADDDIVTITTPLVNIPIMVGTDLYYFNLLGFSTDGGLTFQNVFSSPEGGSNTALLYGQITQQPVPEPASLFLFGGALMAVAMRMRAVRRRALSVA